MPPARASTPRKASSMGNTSAFHNLYWDRMAPAASRPRSIKAAPCGPPVVHAARRRDVHFTEGLVRDAEPGPEPGHMQHRVIISFEKDVKGDRRDCPPQRIKSLMDKIEVRFLDASQKDAVSNELVLHGA
eukprot:scaffold12911_cov35-Tisochrysis_lutea.AAC.2